MKRRLVLCVAVTGVMVALAALAAPKKQGLLLLEWAARGNHEAPPVAVLIELGVKDTRPTPWSGSATVNGAKVVHREGYRFRDGDRLVEPSGWEASSHRGLRVPAGPAGVVISRQEGTAGIGIVLHLADIRADATLTLEAKDGEHPKVSVPLKEVLAGRTKPVWDGAAVVRLVTTATPVVTAKTEDDFPAAAYGPDGTLWVAYISYTVRDEDRRIEQPNYREQPKDFKALYTPEFADQLFVKSYRDGRWSEPIAVTGPHEDLVRCAIGVEGGGTVWAAYSANRQGKHDVYVKPIRREAANGVPRPGPEQNLTGDKRVPIVVRSSLGPVLCTDRAGRLWLACQVWARDNAQIVLFSCDKGTWDLHGGVMSPNLVVKEPEFANAWHPALAAGPRGEVARAHDTYGDGDYDVSVERDTTIKEIKDRKGWSSDTWRFEARPSLAYDPRGRLWVAYEEGPEKWGKDYGAFAPDQGHPLYDGRSVRVVCLDTDGKAYRPAAELPAADNLPPDPLHERAGGPPTFQNYEKVPRYAYPNIGIDGKGRVWLTYRRKFGTRYSTHPGSYWFTFARRLDGDHWTEPVEVHHSDGLLDSRPALLPHAAGGLVILHNTDGRYTTPERIDNDIYMSYLDLPGEPAEPKLVPCQPAASKYQSLLRDKKQGEAVTAEVAAVKRLRGYRVECGGRTYRPLRGEFHRHTEISWDGGPDGSLEDMFRYAIDAAALDWIGNTDHDNGAGREYPWWLTQKLTDAYHVKDAFTPVFAYERSVNYPMGHRNCVFAQRGVRTLPRLAEPDPARRVGGVHADDTKMLYRYLHELNGICASHTSATGMGTDWRDNDPEVEPVVEIYQGDRMSYEYQEAPRAGYGPDSGKKPVSIGGWEPLGFLNHALGEKGYRLGFESSSDHWSTHISFTVVLAEGRDRKAIVDALRKRHSYGATDNIVLDVRCGDHVMGDEFKTQSAPALQLRVIGTGSLDRIDVLRDSEVVETLRPGRREYQGTWTDPKPVAGRHYYYVRVQQADRQLAWASPLWIDYAP
jgi:hypothetical protein